MKAITDEMKNLYLVDFREGYTVPEAVDEVWEEYGIKHSRQLIHQSVRRWVEQGLLKELPPKAKAGRKPNEK